MCIPSVEDRALASQCDGTASLEAMQAYDARNSSSSGAAGNAYILQRAPQKTDMNYDIDIYYVNG